ncbi:hypothetical protein Tco_0575597 [Tanacetum coccineum]
MNIKNDYKAKYKRVIALLEDGPSNTQTPKPFQTKNKCLVAKTYDWDEEEVTYDDEEMVEVKVLLALSKDERMNGGKTMIEMVNGVTPRGLLTSKENSRVWCSESGVGQRGAS